MQGMANGLGRGLLMAVLVGSGVWAAERVVQVRSGEGGPQILVDGRAVAPRMFYGTRLGGQLAVDVDWRELGFDFVADMDVAGSGTLHFRFAPEPNWLEIREVRIRALDGAEAVQAEGTFATAESFAGFWNVWPPAERNTVGTATAGDGVLRVVLRAPADGK